MLDRSDVMVFSATTRPAEALAFYRDVLGLRLIADEPYAIVFDCHGIMLRVQRTRQHTPAGHTLLGWKVADMKAAVRDLTSRGVVFERYPHVDQDADGVWTTPDGTQVAWFKDPDGNILSLTAFAV
jgi:catechol 2,3-dioxygenase-like lactoylglutathione lyase family enzyme